MKIKVYQSFSNVIVSTTERLGLLGGRFEQYWVPGNMSD